MKKMRGFFVALLISIVGFAQQSITITGEVISQVDLLPLPGASVFVPSKTVGTETDTEDMIKSYSIGTVTDFDGKFSLKVPKNTTEIAVSFLGHKPKTVLLTGDKKYVIYLEGEITDLNEVIVTGYQKIKKKRVTAAIDKIVLGEEDRKPISSLDQVIQGKVAGLAVVSQSGTPGQVAKLRIRGVSSLNGVKDPLWVVDGLPLEDNQAPNFADKEDINSLKNYSIAGINANDIESITILKDAAATAIYGARAANGVIVVETKNGQKGKMSINFSTNTFINFRPDFDKLNLMNSNQKVDFELNILRDKNNSIVDNRGEVYRILNDSKLLSQYRTDGFDKLPIDIKDRINNLRNNNTDWGRLLYRDAINQEHNISISGGGKKNTYYFSLSMYDEESPLKDVDFKKYTATLNNEYEVNDKLTIGARLFVNQNDKKSYLTNSTSFTNPNVYSRDVNPYVKAFDKNGDYFYDKDLSVNGDDEKDLELSLMEEKENTSYKLKNRSFKGIFDFKYNFIPNLQFRTQLGLQLDNTTTEKFAGEKSYYTRFQILKGGSQKDPVTKKKINLIPDGAIFATTNQNYFQYNIKNILEYTKLFSNTHDLSLLIGSEFRRNYTDTYFSKAFGYDVKTMKAKPLNYYKSGSIYDSFTKNENENAYVSFYSTASYTYDNRYTLGGSIRFDGSNLFGVDPKYKYLPIWSVSGAWTVSNESFLRNNEIVSNFRLRGSYGVQGNIDRTTSPFLIGAYNNANILGVNEDIIDVANHPNRYLRWEKTTTTDLGIDLGFLNNRFNIVFDWYNRKGEDIIGSKSIPQSSGYSYANVNWAEISNKGMELTLNTKNFDGDDFKWSTGITIAKNKSNVDKLTVNEESVIPRYREGYPVNAVFAFKTAGVDKDGYPIFLKEGSSDPVNTLDFFKLVDLFDPAIGVPKSLLTNKEKRNLLTYVGDRDPEFYGGFTNKFTYKNVSFTIGTNFIINQTVTNIPSHNLTKTDLGKNYPVGFEAGIVKKQGYSFDPAVDKTVPQKYFWYDNISESSFAGGAYRYLDTWVKKMSYLRISSLRFDYSLPKDVIENLRIGGLKLYVEGRNLFVISDDYTGYFDPETYGNIYAQPITKSVILGAKISF